MNENCEVIQFTDKITVGLVDSMGSDDTIYKAAKVSVDGILALEDNNEKQDGLIRYLMKQRHGTPFEHNAMTFFVHAPILVFREFHRHRIGWSYNEESGRYKTLDPVFYLPPYNRPMFKVDNWKPGRPKFTTITGPGIVSSNECKYEKLKENLRVSYGIAYESYKANLEMGFDPGLARDCLPVGIYSSMYATCNARSLMAFLSLRTYEEKANHPSYPLYEIEVVARQMEVVFADLFPITHNAFNDFGRECP